ncbi:ArsR family transcriptional regulator [Ruegeria sp.]|uniref:winged helix-turn-helix domain-containing protein n=1 Tax=Ruegeria sp. TaxID=1879320 RepID=UPI003B5A116D
MIETTDPTRQTPASQLAAAVIMNAVLELFYVAGATSQLHLSDKRDNISFFTATTGEWAESRRSWCDMAGFDEGQLRKRVIAYLEGDEELFWTTNSAHSLRGDKARVRAKGGAQSREIWRERNARPAPVSHSKPVKLPRIVKPTPKPEPRKSPKPTATRSTPEQRQQRILDALKDRPLTIRQLVFATDGDFDTTTIRTHLERLQSLGLVEKDGPEWQVAPKLPVAACAG